MQCQTRPRLLIFHLWEIGHFDLPKTIEYTRAVHVLLLNLLMLQKANKNEKKDLVRANSEIYQTSLLYGFVYSRERKKWRPQERGKRAERKESWKKRKEQEGVGHHTLCDVFVPQKLSFSKILIASLHVIWLVCPSLQSKYPVAPMHHSTVKKYRVGFRSRNRQWFLASKWVRLLDWFVNWHWAIELCIAGIRRNWSQHVTQLPSVIVLT